MMQDKSAANMRLAYLHLATRSNINKWSLLTHQQRLTYVKMHIAGLTILEFLEY